MQEGKKVQSLLVISCSSCTISSSFIISDFPFNITVDGIWFATVFSEQN